MITRDKIVYWAEQSGIEVRDYYDEQGCTVNELQKFAERVVQDYVCSQNKCYANYGEH